LAQLRHYLSASVFFVLSACGGEDSPATDISHYSVTTQVSDGGSISPTIISVESGKTISFNLAANDNYIIDDVSGCGGTLTDNTYVTGNVSDTCEVQVRFIKTTTVSGIAQLGLISGGSAKLFKLPEMTILAETTTSSTSETYGAFSFTDVVLADEDYYLIEISGGKDTDPNDDGVVDAEMIDIQGKVTAIVSGSQLVENNIRVTALSDIQTLFIRTNANGYELSDSQLLDYIASGLIQDINDDGLTNSLDLLLFNPLENQSNLKISYHDLINGYINSIHNNAGKDKKLFDVLTLLPPTLSIEGGVFQKVPFSLNALISTYPKTLTAQWLLDGKVIDPLNTIDIIESGNKLLAVNLFNNEELLTTTNIILTAYDTDLMTEKVIPVNEGGVITFNTDNAPEELVGTKIIIPAGALSQQETISIHENSASIIPGTQGVSSSVITFEPSGLRFNKPVTIAIPLFDTVDVIDINNFRIARTDEDGVIDYLSPIKFDAEKSLLYFETDHFSSYVVINKDVEDALTDGWRNPLLTSIVNDIKSRFPNDYSDISNSDWLSYLSTEIAGVGDVGFTVFDAYQAALTTEKIKSDIARDGDEATVIGGVYRGYTEAFEKMYGEKVSPQGGVLSEWNFAQKMLESPVDMLMGQAEKQFFTHPTLTKAYLAFKRVNGAIGDATETINNATDTLNDVFARRFPVDISQANIISKLLNLYKGKLLSVGGEIVSDFSDTNVNWQISLYFSQRKSFSSEFIFQQMKNGYVIDREVVRGWYDGSFIPSGTPPDNFWEMVEGLYLKSTRVTSENPRIKTLLDTAIELENIEVPPNDFYMLSYQMNNDSEVIFKNEWDHSAIEVSALPNERFIVSFTLQAEGDDEYINSFAPEFYISSLPNKCFVCDDDLSGLTYDVVGFVNLSGGDVTVIDVEFTYPGNAQETDYEIKFKYEDSLTSILNDGRKFTIKRKSINLAPVVSLNTIPNTSFTSGAEINLSATASDPEGGVSLEWYIITTHDIEYDGKGSTFTFTAPDVTSSEKLNVVVVVTDDKGKESSESIELTINPADNNQGEDVVRYNHEALTKILVSFKDSNGALIANPMDSYIRLIPTELTAQNNYNIDLNCEVNSEVVIGAQCLIEGNNTALFNNYLSDNTTTYQVVIYKNHIDPWEDFWNCGEDVYRFVSSSTTINGLSNIVVLPSDYQDRSGECDDDD